MFSFHLAKVSIIFMQCKFFLDYFACVFELLTESDSSTRGGKAVFGGKFPREFGKKAALGENISMPGEIISMPGEIISMPGDRNSMPGGDNSMLGGDNLIFGGDNAIFGSRARACISQIASGACTYLHQY